METTFGVREWRSKGEAREQGSRVPDMSSKVFYDGSPSPMMGEGVRG